MVRLVRHRQTKEAETDRPTYTTAPPFYSTWQRRVLNFGVRSGGHSQPCPMDLPEAGV